MICDTLNCATKFNGSGLYVLHHVALLRYVQYVQGVTINYSSIISAS